MNQFTLDKFPSYNESVAFLKMVSATFIVSSYFECYISYAAYLFKILSLSYYKVIALNSVLLVPKSK